MYTRGLILCENRFNLKTIFKAILANLERIIRLFSLKWPKSPWEIVFKFKLFSYKIGGGGSMMTACSAAGAPQEDWARAQRQGCRPR